MALNEKLGGQGVPKILREQSPIPPPVEKPKDSSAWKGKPFLRGEDVRGWAKSDEAYKETNLSREKREEIAKGLFEKSGDYLKKEKVEKAFKKLKEDFSYAKTDIDRKKIYDKMKIIKAMLDK